MTSFLLLVFLGLAGGSLAARVPHIIGGADVPDIIYWPWQGSLRQRFAEQISCGCSMISATWAVTAASCITSPPYEVKFGDRDQRPGYGVTKPTAQIIVHERYGQGEGTKPNDIAVLKFSPFELSDKIKPVKIARNNEERNTNCFITGWGYTNIGVFKTLPNILRQVRVNPMTQLVCRGYWGNLVNDDQICAMGVSTEANGGICDGDFGGPMLCYVDTSYQLVGISSWADSTCSTTKPSVFTRVTSFRAWITKWTDVDYTP